MDDVRNVQALTLPIHLQLLQVEGVNSTGGRRCGGWDAFETGCEAVRS